jgi:hypothetical protein
MKARMCDKFMQGINLKRMVVLFIVRHLEAIVDTEKAKKAVDSNPMRCCRYACCCGGEHGRKFRTHGPRFISSVGSFTLSPSALGNFSHLLQNISFHIHPALAWLLGVEGGHSRV